MTTLTMSNAPAAASAAIESQMLREKAKTNVATPKPATVSEKRPPNPSLRRTVREDHRHCRRSETAGAAQQAEAECADVQNLHGIDRQQRARAAEEDREQIERYRPEHDRPRGDEAQTVERRLLVELGFRGPLRSANAHEREAGECGGDERRGNQERRRIGDRQQRAARRRAGDDHDLAHRGIARLRLDVPLRTNDVYQDCALSRISECARGAQHGNYAECQDKVRNVRERKPGENQRTCRFHDRRRDDDGLTVVAIDRVTRHEDEKKRRGEHSEPDQPKVERAMVDGVDRPADCNRLDLARAFAGQKRKEVRGDISPRTS